MKNQERYELKGFAHLLAIIAEEYHLCPTDVLLLVQEHTKECASYFQMGEDQFKVDKTIEEIENEKPSEDSTNS